MTTKFLDNKICTFKILLSWRFPRKQAFWDNFPPCPQAPPLKSEIFIFIVVSPALSLGPDQAIGVLWQHPGYCCVERCRCWSGMASASPKPHPSKPHPCNMPQAKTEVALQFLECCAAEVALQHWLFCSAEVILTKSCAAASEKLHCNIEKAALQESGAFLPLSCGFQAPTFRHPCLGPADGCSCWGTRPAAGPQGENS